jgi:hypothetical protein
MADIKVTVDVANDHYKLVMVDKTNFQSFLSTYPVRPMGLRAADNYSKKGSHSPLHNGLRPIHFINHGGFNSAAISLQACAIITKL